MTYYKTIRYIEGKLRWIITDDDENIIKNPTDEQRKIAIQEDRHLYARNKFKKRICCICGSNKTHIDIHIDHHLWFKYSCNNKIGCTGYICHNCQGKHEQHISQWRNGELDPSSPLGRGFIGQQIVANTYKIDDCNIKMDNFSFYVDLSKHPEYGYCEIRTRSLNVNYQWTFDTNRPQEYDTLILVCMDNKYPWKDVERVYVIAWDIIVNRCMISVTITKNPSKGVQWYDEFRIDERPFNETYHNMKLKNCNVLRKYGK